MRPSMLLICRGKRSSYRQVASRRAVMSLVLVVSIGVAAFVVMSGAWLDLDNARARFYAQTRLHDMQVIARRIPRTRVLSFDNLRSAATPAHGGGHCAIAMP